MRSALQLIAAVALVAMPTLALPHPGGLNAEGCHNNRKTGEYHCHRESRAGTRSSDAPRQSFAPPVAPRAAAARSPAAPKRVLPVPHPFAVAIPVMLRGWTGTMMAWDASDVSQVAPEQFVYGLPCK
ncbi:nuclease [Mizugakiibacter sediminis]|uniref:Nuclease n=1 Tax=Mizugakiibacter sediminis TaxID=1475481 RepID=A0A0K8QQJ7_9GAMM|nr:nuclease [Mizugakiibacter sediminis]